MAEKVNRNPTSTELTEILAKKPPRYKFGSSSGRRHHVPHTQVTRHEPE